MAVPKFERFLGPTLQSLSDGEARPIDDVVDLVAWHFNLSDAERSAMTRGGSNTQVRDRINWSTTYLGKAGLLARPFRNQVQITDRGRSVLRDLDHGATLDLSYLQRFPEFVDFQQRRGTRRADGDRRSGTIAESAVEWNTRAASDGGAVSAEGRDAPRCRLIEAMQQFVTDLDAPQLLAVAETLLVSAGYHTVEGERGNPNDDGSTSGVSMVMGLDALGLARVLVQVVQSEAPIQSAAIHRFAREMSMRRCRFGVMVAQDEFVPDAREALTLIERDVMLIDGAELARRLADRALGLPRHANGNTIGI